MINAYTLPNSWINKSRIEKLNHIQYEAVLSLKESDWIGTVCMATGLGKTFVAFKYLYELKNRGLINKDDEIWFLAETTTRERTFIEESEKFSKVYATESHNFLPFNDFNIHFYCYQSQPEGNPKVIIADEVHESLTPIYKKVYDNNYTYLLALSATIPQNLQVYRDDEDNNLTKGELLELIAPIKFYYPLNSAVNDGILSPYKTTVIKHELDSLKNNITEKTKDKTWLTTERKYYSYRRSVVMNPFKNKFYKGKLAKEMCRLLWNLESKAEVVKKLLPTLEGKTIIFGVELKLLDLITDNVVKGGNKKQEIVNNQLITDFNNGDINVIAAAKKLKQGITLEGVTNCIIVSYYKESWHMIQQLGRIVRFVPEKLANLYIIKTNDTYEDKWFDKINKICDSKNKVIEEIDLNIDQYILSENILLNDY